MSRDFCCCRDDGLYLCWPQALKTGQDKKQGRITVAPVPGRPIPTEHSHCGDEEWPCDQGCRGDWVNA